MDVQQLCLKVFAASSSGFDQAELIPIFHRWIQEKRIPDRLLIDVADYRHVHEGPGVMLIANECHFGLDEGGGRLGLRYARKRDEPGPAGERLEEAFRDALGACRLLEEEPSLGGSLRFAGGEVRVEVQSRLVAPNTPETYEAFRPELEAFLDRLYPGAARSLSQVGDERSPFAVDVRVESEEPVASLLERLGAPA